jgi:hypothetical protein
MASQNLRRAIARSAVLAFDRRRPIDNSLFACAKSATLHLCYQNERPMMSRTEICRRLHDMVDELHDKDSYWDDGVYAVIKITYRHRDDPHDGVRLVVGIEPPEDDD